MIANIEAAARADCNWLRGVTSLILEGAYLTWWMRAACINRSLGMDDFERGLARIGILRDQSGRQRRTAAAESEHLQLLALLQRRLVVLPSIKDAEDGHGGGVSAMVTRRRNPRICSPDRMSSRRVPRCGKVASASQ
jgi:hypothetical protein